MTCCGANFTLYFYLLPDRSGSLFCCVLWRWPVSTGTVDIMVRKIFRVFVQLQIISLGATVISYSEDNWTSKRDALPLSFALFCLSLIRFSRYVPLLFASKIRRYHQQLCCLYFSLRLHLLVVSKSSKQNTTQAYKHITILMPHQISNPP